MKQAEAMKHADRVAAAVRMQSAGASYRVIAEALGCSPATAMRWVKGAFAEAAKATDDPKAVIAAAVRDHRAESHRLLDAVVDANLDLAGTPGNGNLLVRTIETRARMEGLMAAPVPQPAAAAAWATAQVIIEHRDGSFTAGNRGEVIDETRNHIIVRGDTISPPTCEPGESWSHYAARCREVGREPPAEDTWHIGPRDGTGT